MKLQMLKPRVATLTATRAPIISQTQNPQALPRARGRKWMAIRYRWLREHPLCVECERAGRIAVATRLDHITPLIDGGRDDETNYQGLCEPCHDAKTAREAKERGYADGWKSNGRDDMSALMFPVLEPSRIPLTIVCGPAGGGKSTYIKEHKRPSDLVIDMDDIRAELGIGIDQWDSRTLRASLTRRNEILGGLARANASAAWFIVSAATSSERDWWRKSLSPTEVIIVTADERTRIDRIQSTRKGSRAARSMTATRKWTREFTSGSQDKVIWTDGRGG